MNVQKLNYWIISGFLSVTANSVQSATVLHELVDGLNLIGFVANEDGITTAAGLDAKITEDNPGVEVRQIFSWNRLQQNYQIPYLHLEDGTTIGDFELVPGRGYFVELEGTGSLLLTIADTVANLDLAESEQRFTKIGSDGSLLSNDATEWDCVLDRGNGLMWEVKPTEGWRSSAFRYTYVGGAAGTESNYCSYELAGTDNEFSRASCDVDGYLYVMEHTGGLCGYGDWRMPTLHELYSLVHESFVSPAIDTDFFPNTGSSSYWSSSDYGSGQQHVVSFSTGNSGYEYDGSFRSYHGRVRLVRGGQ